MTADALLHSRPLRCRAICTTGFHPLRSAHRYCWRCFQWHRFGLALEHLRVTIDGLALKT